MKFLLPSFVVASLLAISINGKADSFATQNATAEIAVQESQPTNPAPQPTDPVPVDPLTTLQQQYDTTVKAIIDNECQVCHARQRRLNFVDFNAVKAKSALMAGAVSSGSMPPRGMPAQDKDTLVTFLNALAALP